MKKVMVFGTFDGIHEGHLNLFKQAKEYGDYLIAVVGRDEVVKKIKGKYPERTEEERFKDLEKQDIVDEVRLGDLVDPYRIINEIKPDAICLGYDQSSFTENLKEKTKIETHRLKAYKPDKYHSSILKKTCLT